MMEEEKNGSEIIIKYDEQSDESIKSIGLRTVIINPKLLLKENLERKNGNKKTVLIIGLNNEDVKSELIKINYYHKNARCSLARFSKRDLIVETENILYKGVNEKSLSNLDGFICKEFILTPHLLKCKSTNELTEIIDSCKAMQITLKH